MLVFLAHRKRTMLVQARRCAFDLIMSATMSRSRGRNANGLVLEEHEPREIISSMHADDLCLNDIRAVRAVRLP